MNRSLTDILGIVSDLKAVYDPIAGKTLTTTQTISAAQEVIAVLTKHNVSLAEIADLLTVVSPFISLIK